MSFAVKKIIKRFDFTGRTIREVDRSGGLRVNLKKNSLELPVDPETQLYSLEDDLTAKTWVTTPKGVRKWLLFELVKVGSSPSHTIGIRLTDGIDEFWHDGADWVVNTTEWNAEAEVADHIESFPTSLKALGVVLHLKTDNPHTSPKVRGIKVLGEYQVNHLQDYVHQSLRKSLEEGVRGRGRFQVKGLSGQTTVSIDQVRLASRYQDAEIDGVYLADDDETNLLDSQDGSDLTLYGPLVDDTTLIVTFNYRFPVVVVAQDLEYLESDGSPQILLSRVQEMPAEIGLAPDETIVHPTTNEGFLVYGPRVSHIEFTIDIYTRYAYEAYAAKDELCLWAMENRRFRSLALDELFDLVVDQEPKDNTRASHELRHRVTMGCVIRHAVFFERLAVPHRRASAVLVRTGGESITLT